MRPASINDDFYNKLNELMGNSLPDNVRSIKIEASVDSPFCITIEYYLDNNLCNTAAVTTKFGLIEYPYE